MSTNGEGEGGKNPQNSANVVNGCPLMPPMHLQIYKGEDSITYCQTPRWFNVDPLENNYVSIYAKRGHTGIMALKRFFKIFDLKIRNDLSKKNCAKKYLEIGMFFLFLGRSPVLWLFEGYMPLCRVRIIVILKIFAEHQIHKKNLIVFEF